MRQYVARPGQRMQEWANRISLDMVISDSILNCEVQLWVHDMYHKFCESQHWYKKNDITHIIINIIIIKSLRYHAICQKNAIDNNASNELWAHHL